MYQPSVSHLIIKRKAYRVPDAEVLDVVRHSEFEVHKTWRSNRED